jgi:hypothetical protein
VAAYRALVIRISVGEVALPVEPLGVAPLGRQGSYPGRTLQHYEGGRSSSLRTGRFYPQEFFWYSFLEAESTPAHMIPSIASEKIPSDTTGDRSRDSPTISAVS